MDNSTPHISIRILRLIRPLLGLGEAVRPIHGASRHFASTEGNIISVYHGRARRLKGSPMKDGYLQARIRTDDGRDWRPGLHRVIALAFHGPPPLDSLGQPFDVHHINGNRIDNQPGNLEYVARRAHSQLTARSTNGSAKLDAVAVWTARCRCYNEPFAQVLASTATELGMTKAAVSQALRGRTWYDIPMPGTGIALDTLACALGVDRSTAADLLALDPSTGGRRAA